MKPIYMIAGLPVYVHPDKIYELGGDLHYRSRKYFASNLGKHPYFSLSSASYIDNYLALNRIDDEELRRNMAWEFTKNTMSINDNHRPDHYFMGYEGDSLQVVIKNKFINLLDKNENGWCNIRYLLTLDPNETWTIGRFFDEVIVEHNIDYNADKLFKNMPVIKINLFDFAQKYLCKKYDISFEEIDI